MTVREDAIHFTSHLTQGNIAFLAHQLGVIPESLARLRLGYDPRRDVFTFPLRQPNGYIIGISNRPVQANSIGTKTTTGEGAGKGLFFYPPGISRDYLIVTEGASDTASVMSAGFSSVVGKMSASSGTESILQLCQRLQPRMVICIRDADPQGLRGFQKLAKAMGTQSLIELVPPSGLKDVREWHQSDPNGLHEAIASHLRRIELSEGEFSRPSNNVLGDYLLDIETPAQQNFGPSGSTVGPGLDHHSKRR